MCLSDLPNVVLTHAASYLDAFTRAFFAASLSINQDAAAASDERNTAIVDHEWITLDLRDIEKDLDERLTDGDISSILMCIDAVNKLKTLKLANCTKITGTCLEPLRGSTMIEQIDLSLVGKNESPKLSPPPPISCEFVLPILDSIIEREGCSLRHLQFPFVWREDGYNAVDKNSVQFVQFLRRYNSTLLNRGVNLGVIGCQKCNRNVVRENENHWIELSGHRFGSQHYTCCECLGYFCGVCEDDGWLEYCERCESRLCEDCQSTFYCTECQECYCVDCEDFIECSVCNRCYRCKDCTSMDWGFCCKCESHFCNDCWSGGTHCDGCRNFCCDDCVQEYGWPSCNRCEYYQFCDDCHEKQDIEKAIRICKSCDKYSCGRCRIWMLDKDEDSDDFCVGCVQIAGRLLLEKNKKDQEEAKAEIKELKHQVGQMQNSNNSLKKQLQCKDRRVRELEEKMKQTNMS